MLEDLHMENIANAVRVTADLSRRRSLRIAYASASGHTQYVVDAFVGSWNRTARGWDIEEALAERTHPQDLWGADVILLASGTWDVRGIERQLNPHMWVSSTTRPHTSTWPVSPVRGSRSGTIDISTRQSGK
jgi:hypothetical protein